MAEGKCSTKSSSSGKITDDNKQEVLSTPSAYSINLTLEMICLLRDIKEQLIKLNTHMSIVTDEDL